MAKFDIQIINILHVEFSLGQGYHMMDNLYIFADVACMEVKPVHGTKFTAISLPENS